MTHQSGENSTISVKAVNVHTNDVRRFALPIDSSLNLLQERLAVFGGTLEGGFQVFWVDDQNDKVSLTTDDELHYAISEQRETKPALLRLAVSPINEKSVKEGWQSVPEERDTAVNPAVSAPTAVEVGAIWSNEEAREKVESYLSQNPQFEGWEWQGEWWSENGTSFAKLSPPEQRDAAPGDAGVYSDIYNGDDWYSADLDEQSQSQKPEMTRQDWDDELAMLQEKTGMPFDQALARMRARREGESKLPELTDEQVSALADDAVFEHVRPMLDDGMALDQAIAQARSMVAEQADGINGGEDEDVATKLVQAMHRIGAAEASARSEHFTAIAEEQSLCYVEGTHGWAEFALPAAAANEPRRLAELLLKYASGEPRPLRLLVDSQP